MREHGEAGQPTGERRGGVLHVAGPPVRARGADVGPTIVRRRPRGPRPVRPPVVAVVVRPAQAPRPACRAVPRRPGQRVLIRRRATASPATGLRMRLRRAAAGLGLAVVAAAVVVGLGTLGEVSAHSQPAERAAPIAAAAVTTVVVGHGETLWDLARRADPTASGAELAALARRIVDANALPTMRVHPGQVLRVTAG